MSIDRKYITDRFAEQSSGATERHRDVQDLGAHLRFLAVKLRRVLMDVEKRKSNPAIVERPQDLFELCLEVDEVLKTPDLQERLSEDVFVVVQEIRKAIGILTLEALYEEKQRGVGYGQFAKHERAVNERDIAKEVFVLIDYIKREQDPTVVITPEWIILNHPELYDRLTKCIKDPSTQILDWGKVLNMLPGKIKERCDLSRKKLDTDRQLVNLIRSYRQIAEAMGPEFLADFLVALDPTIARSFEHCLRIISKYLGRTKKRDMLPTDLPGLPPFTLEKPDLRKVIFWNLRNYVYRHLVKTNVTECGADEIEEPSTSVDEQKQLLSEVEAILGQVLDPKQVEHKKLLDEVVAYFKKVLDLKVSPRLVTKIQGGDGQDIEVPSLRQRIAMYDMEKYNRLLVAFFMGRGKTATTFFCKEHVGAKKMLYICPPGELPNTVASQVTKHYQECEVPSQGQKGQKKKVEKTPIPTVGIITPKMSQADLDKIKEAEIIILPYSMMSSKREMGKITEQLHSIGIDFVAVDEVHWAKKEGGRNTEEVYKFVTEIPELKYVALLSGNATPNSPDDIFPQLRIKDPEAFSDNISSLRHWMKTNDPLRLRSLLLEFVLKLDPPENWEKYVEKVEMELSPAQRSVYDAILNNEDLTVSEKIHQLTLALINPEIVSPQETGNAVLDSCFEIVKEDFGQYDTVIIGEDTYKAGVTRRHKDVVKKAPKKGAVKADSDDTDPDEVEEGKEYPDIPTFVERLREKLDRHYGKGKVDVFVIDGQTSDADRKKYLDQAKNPKGKKTIIVSMSSIIREGIDLSSIHRAILLEPSIRLADTSQFVKRFARCENRDAKVRVLTAPETIYQGIEEHALYKFMLCQRLMEGGTLTDDDLAFLERDDLGGGDSRPEIRDGRLIIGTAISTAAMNNRQTLNAYFRYLQNRGEAEFMDFVDRHGENYADKYTENWEGTYSANNGRFVAGLIEVLKEEGIVKGTQFADVACGPLVFENTYGLMDPKAQITNFDANPYILDAGVDLIRKRKHNPYYEPTKKVCPMTKLDAKDGSYDVVNCASALHYLGQKGKKNIDKHERAKALIEMNRILKQGGVMVLTLPQIVCSDDEFDSFKKEMMNFGFEVLGDYTGNGHSTDMDNDTEFLNRVVTCKKVGTPKTDKICLDNLHFERQTHVAANTGKTRKKTKDPNYLSQHMEFEINDTELEYDAQNGETDVQAQNVKYQKLVVESKQTLLEIYAKNGNSLDTLTEEDQAELNRKGIVLMRIAGVPGNGKWMFSLRDQKLKVGLSHYVFEEEK